MMSFGRLGCVGVIMTCAMLWSCSDDSADKSPPVENKSWRCQTGEGADACTCYWEGPETNLSMEVSECKAAEEGKRCCMAGADAAIPNCTCGDIFPTGCPTGQQEIYSCSSAPPP